MKFSAAMTGLAALSLPATAMAQDQRCIPQAQSEAVVAYLLPDMLESAGDRCARQLGRDAYLSTNAGNLADRLQPLAERSWPEAKRGLENAFASPLPDDPNILAFGRKAIADGITKDLDQAACGVVSDLTRELAPLPPQNFANVFALFLRLGINGSPDSELRICEA
ncbi:hypothetical protein [Erythrobacter sp.]|jgi:hypothetical protein|uniref:hypothetical protein n=1 Tax=Erythrobacter sp. TaxID=1042 RepID=UPI002E9CE9F2|nr:hypothetical protein [Erythrobacter sp.]